MAYSEVNDLLTGNVPTPAYLSPQKYVDDAADEIDSKIGFIYQTPVDVSGSQVVRPAVLLLKRINNFLASGRLLMAVDAGGEDTQLHAYGLSLVKDATAALDQIASGAIALDGAPKIDTTEDARVTSPLIFNEDAESNVSAFYDRLANPNFTYTSPSSPTGMVR